MDNFVNFYLLRKRALTFLEEMVEHFRWMVVSYLFSLLISILHFFCFDNLLY